MAPRARTHWRRGLKVTVGLALGLAALALAVVARSYDGHCGGYFPGLAAPRPCSRWEFVSGDGPAILLVLAVSDWPLLLLLALPPAVGWWLDRRR